MPDTNLSISFDSAQRMCKAEALAHFVASFENNLSTPIATPKRKKSLSGCFSGSKTTLGSEGTALLAGGPFNPQLNLDSIFPTQTNVAQVPYEPTQAKDWLE